MNLSFIVLFIVVWVVFRKIAKNIDQQQAKLSSSLDDLDTLVKEIKHGTG